MKQIAATILVLGVAAPALALGPETPYDIADSGVLGVGADEAFTSGRFDEAAARGKAAGSADGYAFAARAILADCMSASVEPPKDQLKEAEHLSRVALSLDDDHVEARMNLAISLSFQARPMSVGEARSTGYGELSRDLAKEVLEDDPNNFYAHGFLSVWNIEVIRRGGTLGRLFMGASMDDARDHYDAAVAAKPGDAGLHWQYARALAAQKAKKHEDEINQALDAALASRIDDVVEQVMYSRAVVLSSLMETRDWDEVEDFALSTF